ncbi:hypothetical protein [Nitrobacter vulgaris]|uniref:Helix-turn-helix domain-containing protein n=1 Tax=Nitrobacter vulgaris TaxID=29421 RepID=A0A1V4I1M0_NITVU|nr:hypothetical protein [Nitrobacter vulgaris]OPH84128.1 hypothetical protein B2M20_03050 [Nitrobacter vulgaris]
MSEGCMTLIPYDKREGIPLNVAAERAGKSPGTVRNWCIEHGIGRRVGGGQWIVSKVALAMFLDGDYEALRRYKSGDRSSDCVVAYFKREGLERK